MEVGSLSSVFPLCIFRGVGFASGGSSGDGFVLRKRGPPSSSASVGQGAPAGLEDARVRPEARRAARLIEERQALGAWSPVPPQILAPDAPSENPACSPGP